MHDVDHDFRTGQPHRQHRHQGLPAGNDARLVAVLGQRRMRFGKRLGAEIIEASGLHARLPNSHAKPTALLRSAGVAGERVEELADHDLGRAVEQASADRRHLAADLGVVVVR